MKCCSGPLLLSFLALVTLFSGQAAPAWGAAVPTVTTLTMTAGGNLIASGASLASGTALTLTATVAAGTGKVTAGQVIFCDASVTYCTDIYRLGTAQVTAAGTAVLAFTPAVGSHSYKAVYGGTPRGPAAWAASTSAVVALTVTGLYPSTTTIAAASNGSPYTLTTVVGGVGPEAPTGTVSILNTSNGNAVLGTAGLGEGSAGLTFIDPAYELSPPILGFLSFGLQGATGDFNGDGILDIAVANPAGCETGVCWRAGATALLGDLKGHFVPAATADLGDTLQASVSIAAADFNGDGILDLAAGSSADKSVTILLGNGDGTFTAKSTVPSGGAFPALAVADFNGDGIPDLAILNTTANIVTLFLGNGDGTFTAAATTPPSAGANPAAIAVGDFNGDGIADLAIANNNPSGTLTILLGNGDGTFTAAPSPTTGSGPDSIATGDFNSDGILDLAVANANDGTLTILLGNGDGTFAPAPGSPFPSQTQTASLIVVGDFNGDGKVDLVVRNIFGNAALALGHGDGTFTVVPEYTDFLAAGDANGDGTTDLIGPGDVAFAVTQTATASTTGVALPPGSGFQNVLSSYPGDTTYTASVSAMISLSAPAATPTVTLTASPNPVLSGSFLTLTAAVAGPGVTPTGLVTFYTGSTSLGGGYLHTGGVVTLTTTTLPVGSWSILASYAGDNNYLSANSAPVTVTVEPVGTIVPTMTLTASPSTITNLQSLTMSVTVIGPNGGATPTGVVTLTYNGSSSSPPTQQSLANGTTSFTLPSQFLVTGANTLGALYGGDATYASSSATTTVTLAQVALAVPAPAAVLPGSSITATATVSAGTNYSGTVNLTCSLTSSPAGAQSLPTCSISPASVTLQTGGSATSVLAVTTTAASTSLLRPLRDGSWTRGGDGAILAVLAIWGIPRRRRRWLSMLVILLIGACATIGCSGGSKSTGPSIAATTAGTYTFTVTGQDSATSTIITSTTVNVTVQ